MRPDDLEAATFSPAQRRLLQSVAHSELAENVYLTGGAALAGCYLHHRYSRDLDLFSADDIPIEVLRAFLDNVSGVTVQNFQRRYDRRIFLLQLEDEQLEVEFTRYPFPRLEPVERLPSGLAVDTPVDMLANKIAALVDRNEPKDEVDVYVLLRAKVVPDVVAAADLAEKKFGIPGLRYPLQSRLLAVSSSLPATDPPIDRDEIVSAFREAARALVASAAET